jgi:D-alanyl-D-alanine carboxypeptidase
MKKLLLFFIVFFMQSAFADQANDIMTDLLKASLQTYVNHWRSDNHVPGMALTVYQPGKQTLITITSGKRRLNPAAPVTENTFFQIGSITKTFTSAAILKLESEGKLSINNKIGKWFPQYPRWKNITIRQLLNMTSGINGYEANPEFSKNELKKEWTTHDLINLAYKIRQYSQPGVKWHYSNTNYLLLGEIIEKVTHESLDSIFNRYFYSKYHLNHTVVMSDTYGPE